MQNFRRGLEGRGEIYAARISTWEIDAEIEKFIRSTGARPNFKGLYGFPGSACISVNEVLIHGIPFQKDHLEGRRHR